MTFISQFINLGIKIMEIEIVSLYLNEFRKNLAANLDRSPLIKEPPNKSYGVPGYGYASADDRSTLFAIFPLIFVPFMQYAG